MKPGEIILSLKELDRLPVVKLCAAKKLSQADAARQLRCGVRQVKRLVREYRKNGSLGLLSKRRGKPSNNQISLEVQAVALALIRQHYGDFSPTFAHEKLTEVHKLKFSVETLRQWMIQAKLWIPKKGRKARIHQSRLRRSCVGELIQIDGSPHDWFEDRGPRCTLIVFIDDATSRLMSLKFSPSETTEAYMETLSGYLKTYGRPVSFYNDKHAIFRVNHPGKEGELTQFGRALKTLDIEGIPANSPQAKGRVERANQTLQNRLIKEMRLANISSIEEANRWLPQFMEDFNRRFAVQPRSAENAHRPILHTAQELELILSLHHDRKLSKNLTLQFKNQEYQLVGYGNGYRLRGASVRICEGFDGKITLLHQGKLLDFRVLQQGEEPTPMADDKTINSFVNSAKTKQNTRQQWKPNIDHPWRNYPSQNLSAVKATL